MAMWECLNSNPQSVCLETIVSPNADLYFTTEDKVNTHSMVWHFSPHARTTFFISPSQSWISNISTSTDRSVSLSRKRCSQTFGSIWKVHYIWSTSAWYFRNTIVCKGCWEAEWFVEWNSQRWMENGLNISWALLRTKHGQVSCDTRRCSEGGGGVQYRYTKSCRDGPFKVDLLHGVYDTHTPITSWQLSS